MQSCTLYIKLRYLTCILCERGIILNKKDTCFIYQKYLDLDKKNKIENKWSFSRIAKDINKSSRTISCEILKNRNIKFCKSLVGKSKTCEKKFKYLM